MNPNKIGQIPQKLLVTTIGFANQNLPKIHNNFPRVISTDILSEYSDSLSVILSEFAIGLTSILTFYLAYFRVHVRSE